MIKMDSAICDFMQKHCTVFPENMNVQFRSMQPKSLNVQCEM